MRCRNQGGVFHLGVTALALVLGAGGVFGKPPAKEPVVLVVMDPLARELACACVKGYGQRDYRKLAARLESALKQRVSIEFSDDLFETLALVGSGREIIVVGEYSLVAHGAKRAPLHERGNVEHQEPAIRAGCGADQRDVRVLCLPQLLPRLHPASFHGGRDSGVAPGDGAQSILFY